MKNSYTTLHRNLDNRIHTLENEHHPNQTLITDLKKQKLKLKDNTVNEQMDSFVASEKVRAKKLVDSMISDQKRSDKRRRKSRKKRIQYAVRADKVSLSG
ncbi:MAG: DUF465 domain-containing protein [Proteobacteria bacterium]|nr:DUF465 domain-containing protein [Pseudomonadota bacterium]